MASSKPHVYVLDDKGHYLDYSGLITSFADQTSTSDAIPSAIEIETAPTGYGNALKFIKKRSSFVDCDFNSSFNLTESDSFSASFRWKKTSNSDENETTIISNYGDSGGGDTAGWEVVNYDSGAKAGKFLVNDCLSTTDWAAGVGSASLSFNDGVTDERASASVDGIDTSSTGFSISCWVQKTGYAGASTDECIMRLTDLTDTILLRQDGPKNIELSAGISVVTTGTELDTSDWVHIIVTCTSAGAYVIYADNVSVKSGSGLTPPNINGTNGLCIAGYPGGPFNVEPFYGKIKDLRFFGDVLTSGERDTIYNSGSVTTTAIGDEVWWYKLDEGTGTTYTDSGSAADDASGVQMANANWVGTPLSTLTFTGSELTFEAISDDANVDYSFPHAVDFGSYDQIEFNAKSGDNTTSSDGTVRIIDSSGDWLEWDLTYYPDWVKNRKYISLPDRTSASIADTSDITSFRFGISTNGNILEFKDIYRSGGYGHIGFKMAGTTTSDANAINVNTVRSFADGDWHNVVVTKDNTSSADSVKIYVDASIQTLTTTSDNLAGNVSNSNFLYLGSRSNATQNKFMDGWIDDVRIYDFDLTQSNVNSINAGDTSDQTSKSDFIAYWAFDEKPKSRAFVIDWNKTMNEVGAATIALAGINELDDNIRVARNMFIVENNLKKWEGPLRETAYSTTKIADLSAKTWEVNLKDRKYYNTTSADYDKDWYDATSSDIISDIITSSDLQEGYLADYKDTYDFHIKNDTDWRGVVKNGDITGFEYYVSDDQQGGEE